MILDQFEEEIKHIVNQNKCYFEMESILKARHGDGRGFSVRSLRRFCKEKNLKKKTTNSELQVIVADTIRQVKY